MTFFTDKVTPITADWLNNVDQSLPMTPARFGAKGDGTDATQAFSLAAKAAIAANTISGIEGTALPRAEQCIVEIPAGTYLLTEEVDTGGREVTWQVAQGAVINGYQFINGKIVRIGERQNGHQHGTNDFACGYSIRSNGDLEDGAEVLGVTDPSQLAIYTDRDSVGLYVDNTSPAATVDVNTATYTATTATIGAVSTTALRRLRRGMIIDTKHSPKWSGVVDSWNADGSVITVTAWYRAGAGGAASTPTDGTGLVVNGFTKVWAHNANIFLTANGYAKGATGFELGVLNNRGDSSVNYADDNNRVWGMDVVNLGTYKGQSAHIARGAFWHGFHSVGQTYGFKYQGRNGIPYTAVDDNNVTYFSVNNDGSMELGSAVDALPRYIDFHTSGNANDYDARIQCSGGTATAGTGTLRYLAAGHEIFGASHFMGDIVVSGSFSMDAANAAIEIGNQSAANTPLLDFHSSGKVNDFDARIMGFGGGTPAGQGDIYVYARALALVQAGSGVRVKEGTNCKQGVSTLVGGSVVVANTSVTATSRIFLTSQADGGTPGFLRVSTRTAGTSFTITSSSASDTSTVAWEIFEPA